MTPPVTAARPGAGWRFGRGLAESALQRGRLPARAGRLAAVCLQPVPERIESRPGWAVVTKSLGLLVDAIDAQIRDALTPAIRQPRSDSPGRQ